MLLASGQTLPEDVALDDASVFRTNQATGSIARVSKAGRPVGVIVGSFTNPSSASPSTPSACTSSA